MTPEPHHAARTEPHQVDDFMWEVPRGYVDGMNVPARVFGTRSIFEKALQDKAVQQIANVATLGGIVGHALAMPDIHWGYGFPIGGVAATDADAGGAISPGGVGFDIGCGVRLVRSDLTWSEVQPHIRGLMNTLGREVPRGVGGGGRMKLAAHDLDKVLTEGVAFALGRGVGWDGDDVFSEDQGTIPDAVPSAISDRAKERGAPQLGSLGGGNHFLEIQVVDEVRDPAAAATLRLFEGQVCVMIHSGSRGIGHQACTDYVRKIDQLMPGLGIDVPDRQLAYVPLDHPVADRYVGAMNAAGNFARANRHVLMDATRAAFAATFGRDARDMGMDLVYDISHNLAKIETYEVEGRSRRLCVHRKGATRAFGPGHPELPSELSSIGQPVIIPGSMGTASFVLTGLETARDLSFSSTCHGAGRAMSRTQAKKQMSGSDLKHQLAQQGIVISAGKTNLLAEEAPYAYKDVSEVVESCEGAGLTKVVARLRPVGVVKG